MLVFIIFVLLCVFGTPLAGIIFLALWLIFGRNKPSEWGFSCFLWINTYNIKANINMLLSDWGKNYESYELVTGILLWCLGWCRWNFDLGNSPYVIPINRWRNRGITPNNCDITIRRYVMSLLTAIIALIVGLVTTILIIKFFIVALKFLAPCVIFIILTAIHPFLGGIYLLYLVYQLGKWIYKKLSPWGLFHLQKQDFLYNIVVLRTWELHLLGSVCTK